MNGRSPLMLAAAANLTAAVAMLAHASADLEHRDLDGACAMHLAFSYGSASAVAALESAGASSDARGSGRTPVDGAGRTGGLHLFG